MLDLENFPPKKGMELEGGIVILPSSNIATRPRGHLQWFALRTLPFSFQLKKDGFLHDVVHQLPLRRLAGIIQLQKMTWLRVGEGLRTYPGPHVFDHNRLEHSLWAAVGHALTNAQLGIFGPEALVGILTEAVHDAFTTAGGDVFQIMFPNSCNDDALIEKLFTDKKYRENWKRIQRKYGLPNDTGEKVSFAVMNGTGLNGNIHEIMDAWSYMACDLDALERAYARYGERIPEHFGKTIVEHGGQALEVWKNISAHGDSVYINNPKVAHDFLKLRVELWRGVYDHPGHKILEYMYRRIFVPPLKRSKKINIDQLMLWTDTELGESVTKWLGVKDPQHLNFGSIFPRLLTFDSWKEAREAEEEAAAEGSLTLLHSMKGDRPISHKTGKYFVKPNGKVVTFEEAFPDKAGEIKTLAGIIPIAGSAWLIEYPGLLAKLPPQLIAAWQKERKAWNKPLGCEMVA